MARGVDGRETFVDHRDRQLFLATLVKLKQENSFTLFAYCLMGNHFHLAIKIGAIPLSRILQRLLTRYASAFNARHGRTGHLFQARYKAVLCLNESYLVRLIDYIHDNPVRSGSVIKAEDWEWSSSGAYSKNCRTGLVDPNDLPLTLGLDED
ncbi:MAG: transposase, partial [Elusimicrobiota bacterium]